MAAALYMAGFQVHDVTMTDICRGDVTLDEFRGLVFVGGFSYADVFGSAKVSQGLFLDHNVSERFESRFSTVRINKTNSLMLKGMEGSTLGIWVAHGEGRFVFKDAAVRNAATDSICLNYVDDNDVPTERYPFNPNGSVDGVAALCSPDGRHLAMMPHPERVALPWQWAWMPEEMRGAMETSPWLQMFHNAYDWCSSANGVGE